MEIKNSLLIVFILPKNILLGSIKVINDGYVLHLPLNNIGNIYSVYELFSFFNLSSSTNIFL